MNLSQAESMEVVVKETRNTLEYRTQSCCWGWQSFGALFGVLGGIVAALVGSAFIVVSWITGFEGNSAHMQSLGTALLFLTIPLLIFGGHCMDLVEKQKGKERKSEFDGGK